MPGQPKGTAVKPITLPFKSAVFRRGLLVVLIPGLLASALLLLLNSLWLSTANELSKEESYGEVMMNFGLCTCSLKNYCYDLMSAHNLNIPAQHLRMKADQKSFYEQLDKFLSTKVPDELRFSGNVDIFASFARASLVMVADAEKISPSPDSQPFNDNVGRLLLFRKLMLRGLTMAEEQERIIDKAENLLIERRAHLSKINSQMKAVLAIGLPVGAVIAFAVMFSFAVGIVIRLRLLARNASNLPTLEVPSESQKIDDEFAYLDNTFRQSAKQLRDAADERQAIAQMLAHDMRSPIMATQIYVDLLQELNAASLSKETLESCHSIKRNLGIVHDFISDLLVAEKLECERIELARTQFTVSDFVAEAINSVEDEARNRDVSFNVECAESKVYADREKSIQALKNYLLNALRFAPAKSVVSVISSLSGGKVKFIIKDAGRPATKNEIEYLFDPFREVPPAGVEGISALGMNLHIAKLLIEANGGSVGGVRTDNGREFWFSLPTEVLSSQNIGSSPTGSQLVSASFTTGNQKIPFKELLSSSNFRNCIAVLGAVLLLQGVWLVWLDNRLNASQALAHKASVQSDTIAEINKLWNRIFYGNTAAAFYLTGGVVEDRAKVLTNVAEARALISRLNVLFSEGGRPTTEWSTVRSFLLYQLTELTKLAEIVEGEHAGYNLGILGRLMNKSGEYNMFLRRLLHDEFDNLSSIRREQEVFRDRFQSLIAFAILSNLVTTVVLVWIFSKNITQRLAVLVDIAEKIPRRAPITEMVTGNDEIYQIYWLLCRASLNLNDAVEQRRAMMKMVAKDIGLPLAEVQKMLTQLEGKMSSRIQESGQRSLKSARDNINRLLALDDDLLSLEQLEEGNLQLEKEACSLAGVIETSVNSVGGLALKKEITITKDCGDIQVKIDRKRMVQVLVNLLSNAIKFSPRQSTITVSGAEEEGRIRLSVKDEGPGLDKADAQKIFARFYQTEEGKRQGFGLGLAICALIVKLHDGEISVESELGKGSTFSVSLPA